MNERGATAVEYGLLVVLAVLGAWLAIELFQVALEAFYENESEQVECWVDKPGC